MMIIYYKFCFKSSHHNINKKSLAKTKGKLMRMCDQKEGNVLANGVKIPKEKVGWMHLAQR